MNDNLADVIVVSVIWIACAAVGVVTKDLTPFTFAVIGTTVFVYLTRR